MIDSDMDPEFHIEMQTSDGYCDPPSAWYPSRGPPHVLLAPQFAPTPSQSRCFRIEDILHAKAGHLRCTVLLADTDAGMTACSP